MTPRYSFGRGAARAGLHPKRDGRLAALVLRAAGLPVTVDGVMDDVSVAFLRQYADVAVRAFWQSRHDGAVESCLECAARDHDELGIRPEAHGVDLDYKAARRAGRRLAAEFRAARDQESAATKSEAA
jgi:hypothetical protein